MLRTPSARARGGPPVRFPGFKLWPSGFRSFAQGGPLLVCTIHVRRFFITYSTHLAVKTLGRQADAPHECYAPYTRHAGGHAAPREYVCSVKRSGLFAAPTYNIHVRMQEGSPSPRCMCDTLLYCKCCMRIRWFSMYVRKYVRSTSTVLVLYTSVERTYVRTCVRAHVLVVLY